jgi:hypothetical protein
LNSGNSRKNVLSSIFNSPEAEAHRVAMSSNLSWSRRLYFKSTWLRMHFRSKQSELVDIKKSLARLEIQQNQLIEAIESSPNHPINNSVDVSLSGLSNQKIAEALYIAVLKRNGSSIEIDGVCKELLNEGNLATIIKRFINSSEFKNNYFNANNISSNVETKLNKHNNFINLNKQNMSMREKKAYDALIGIKYRL